MEKLPQPHKYPEWKKDKIDLEKWLADFQSWVENLFSEIAKKINWLLDRIKIGIIEIVPSGSAIGDDGNWRIYINGNNLEFQRKESGTWVKKGAVTA